MLNYLERLASDCQAQVWQIEAAIALLDGGATVPFIARYRKEATGQLDDRQLRLLEEKLGYWRELEQRRQAIRESLEKQGVLSETLAAALENVDSKQALEDLYLPYRPKRRNKAQAAREAGLSPLAEALAQPLSAEPQALAQAFLNPDQGISSATQALEGARQILMETFAEQPPVRQALRDFCWQFGRLHVQVLPEKQEEGEKFADYFDYSEDLQKIPAHRALAIFRGRKQEILQVNFLLGEDQALKPQALEILAEKVALPLTACDPWQRQTLEWTLNIKLLPALESELLENLREKAEAEAIRVFAENVKDLLLSPPAGAQVTLGLDPGLRTGVKLALVDATGKVLITNTIYPLAPHFAVDKAEQLLRDWCQRYAIVFFAVGNGTGSRETVAFLQQFRQKTNWSALGIPMPQVVSVSEAGASVYSASEYASAEFPDLDVSLRGAVSIARRLQDPLAELVKIDPKAIGVGQYQHDVNQHRLARTLDAVVEDCVNAVGVELNTASKALLQRVSGLGPSLAQAIVTFREQHGAFANRQALLKVPRLGPKAFEQAAGFLRIHNGEEPLDASAVHPEAYPLVMKMLHFWQKPLTEILGQREKIQSLPIKNFIDERFGEATIRDILHELEKPGRDPRAEFRLLEFSEQVHDIKDVIPGMRLPGIVSNVTDFGAFVDIGVHQDGLIHISELADFFVKDPRSIVKSGDHVQVQVLEVDVKRRRIALSLRNKPASKDQAPTPKTNKISEKKEKNPSNNPFGQALHDAGWKK
jgi:uncharacterized protein